MKNSTVSLPRASTSRHRLPAFDCPRCTAKNIVFAASVEAKNHVELIPLEMLSPDMSADFIVMCPKCKGQFALCWRENIQPLPLLTIPFYGNVAT